MTTKSLEDEGEVFTKYGPYSKKMSWGKANITIYIKN